MDYLEIEKVIGREIMDSRGNPTIETEVTVETETWNYRQGSCSQRCFYRRI